MKGILSLIVSFALVIGCFSFVVGCDENETGENVEQAVAEVKLVELSAAVASDETGAKSAASEFTSGVKLADEEEAATAEPQHTTIFKSQNEITFDIKLDNPKNYYIMDFKLNCAEENIEYYDSVMEEWTAITDCWIRWNGSNNQRARYKIRFNDPAVVIDKISVSDMYYSDRTDGTNKTAVNMNDRETYVVYKVDENLVGVETVTNSFEEYVFNVKKADGVVVKSVKCDDTELIPAADGTYKTDKSGKINVEYEKLLDENFAYQSNYECEIELFHLEKMDKPIFGLYNMSYMSKGTIFDGNYLGEYYLGMFLQIPFIGTDLSEKNVKISCNNFIVKLDTYYYEKMSFFIDYPDAEHNGGGLMELNEYAWNELADKFLEEAVITIEEKDEYNLKEYLMTNIGCLPSRGERVMW